jgi:enterochelin esterase-like enzyme
MNCHKAQVKTGLLKETEDSEMYPRGAFAAASLIAVLCVGPAFAQQGAGRGGAPAPRSPEIAPDGKVTFRLSAPDAARVIARNFTGGFADWPAGNDVTMAKGDNGVWSATIGPLKPEYYTYAFVVDGVRTLDPQNPIHMRNGTSYFNVLRVPGELTDDYAINNVPHGTVAQVWYPSPMLKLTRRLYVYTPPGYETGKARFPVLYLLHGGGGDEGDWTNLGRAPQILDNLISRGQAKPMIVVMTNENATQMASPEVGAVPASAAPPGNSMQGQAMLTFPQSIIADLMPFIDRAFRTLPGRMNRAIAGLSMGGGMTLLAAFNHLDQFSWVGTFSAGLPPMPGVAVPINPPPPNAASLRGPDINNTIDKQKLAALLPQLNSAANARLRLYYISIGAQDGLITAHNAYKELLKEKGVNATIVETQGYGHEWAFWRITLKDFAPRLFQAQAR